MPLSMDNWIGVASADLEQKSAMRKHIKDIQVIGNLQDIVFEVLMSLALGSSGVNQQVQEGL